MRRVVLALCLSLSLTQCLAFAPCVIFSGIKRSQRAARSLGPAMQLQASDVSGRREAINKLSGFALGAAAFALKPQEAAAEAPLQDVYFGSGCFWHVQHEIIQAEKKILGRKDAELTSVAGYAGGTKTGPNGRVCYHNPMAMDSDYGRMGHTEVVGVKVPEDKIPQFADAFFALFINGDRADPQDRGGEYRGAFGIPGGDKHPQFAAFKEAAAKVNMKLIAGKGNDPDTSKKRAVFYYDTDNFPFFAGEVYHQYHNDMVENYGREYNALRGKAVKEGRLTTTGCPELF